MIFGLVPKAACTNWKSVIQYMDGNSDYLDPKVLHSCREDGLRYRDPGEQSELLHDQDIKRYSMVRSPYSRVLSAYLNKIESRVKSPEKFGENDFFVQIKNVIDRYRLGRLPTDKYPIVSFEVFLKWLMSEPDRHGYNEHWRSQTLLLRLPDVDYDYIGRFENMDEDTEYLLSMMDCDLRFPTQKDVKFPPTNAKKKLLNYYTDNRISMVNELYNEDFEQLDYEKASDLSAFA